MPKFALGISLFAISLLYIPTSSEAFQDRGRRGRDAGSQSNQPLSQDPLLSRSNCYRQIPNRRSSIGAALAAYAAAIHGGAAGDADMSAALGVLERDVNYITTDGPLNPSMASTEMMRMEKLLNIASLCVQEGQGMNAVSSGYDRKITQIRSVLFAKASSLFSKHGEGIVSEIIKDDRYIAMQSLLESELMRAQIVSHMPQRLAELEHHALPTLERKMVRAREEEQAQQQAAAQASQRRAAALAALPAAAGGWQRVRGETKYQRSGPHGMNVVMQCGRFGGVQLTLKLPQDREFRSIRSIQNSTEADLSYYLTINGNERRFQGRLHTESGQDTVTYRHNQPNLRTSNTTVDTRVAYISIENTEIMANKYSQGVDAISDAFRNATGTSQENIGSIFFDALGATIKQSAPGFSTLLPQIDEVKNLSSLPIAVNIESIGKVPIFDLAPSRAPFRSLMDACWN